MGSSRLPGKSLMAVWDSISLLEMLVRRMRRSKRLTQMVLATTQKDEDQVLIREARKLGLEFFRGSELDLVERFNQLLDNRNENYDYIVRITADNPMTDPELLDEMAGLLDEKDLDYLSVKNMPVGIATDFFKQRVIRELRNLPLTNAEKEHLNLRLLNYPNLYNMYFFEKFYLIPHSNLSFTVDTKEELHYMKILLKRFEKPENLGLPELISAAEKTNQIKK